MEVDLCPQIVGTINHQQRRKCHLRTGQKEIMSDRTIPSPHFWKAENSPLLEVNLPIDRTRGINNVQSPTHRRLVVENHPYSHYILPIPRFHPPPPLLPHVHTQNAHSPFVFQILVLPPPTFWSSRASHQMTHSMTDNFMC